MRLRNVYEIIDTVTLLIIDCDDACTSTGVYTNTVSNPTTTAEATKLETVAAEELPEGSGLDEAWASDGLGVVVGVGGAVVELEDGMTLEISVINVAKGISDTSLRLMPFTVQAGASGLANSFWISPNNFSHEGLVVNFLIWSAVSSVPPTSEIRLISASVWHGVRFGLISRGVRTAVS